MTFTQKLDSSLVVLDGAMGTMLLDILPPGARPERLNITMPERITAVHRAYLDAGSDVIYTNTFGANPIKSDDYAAEIRAGIECAKKAAAGAKDKYIALDIGPTGKLIKPLGDLDFEDAVRAFSKAVAAGADSADLIAIETMSDPYELKAAIIAAKETCELPIIATMVFGSDGKTMTGCSPEAAAALLEGLGVAALGVNCSLSPADMADVVKRLIAVSSVPVIVKANAGLPEERDGAVFYPVGAEKFAADTAKLVRCGARVVGGCCGTTPEHIRAIKAACGKAKRITQKKLTVSSSYCRALYFGGAPVIIGERLNPTGKKRLKQALRENDMAYILGEAVHETEAGAHALDVNVGLPELDEKKVLCDCIRAIQSVTELPLQIDTSDYGAMESAMRIYNGKPLVNSVNGKKESMAAVFPLVKKYGGAVICLTLDENGIPPTAAGRVAIARRIIKEAADRGIQKHDLIFDTLATAVSADPSAAAASLDALETIRKKLKCNVSLGISNISFGLPRREIITSAYFTLALGKGLSAAICDPYSDDIKRAYRAYAALSGADRGCIKYIDYAASAPISGAAVQSAQAVEEIKDTLGYYIRKGLKDEAAKKAMALLKDVPPLDIINGEVIPALDDVGGAFEAKTLFLPQLLMSAEAAGAAFEEIKRASAVTGSAKKTVIVMATVKGDIHDMGKNIVVMLLRNYGFTVHDLGRDVPPERVVAAVKEHGARIAGLSALMTTTVPAMKETVELIKKECPGVYTCVGGAVLTSRYAADMGADKYCKDALDTVRFAESVEKEG